MAEDQLGRDRQVAKADGEWAGAQIGIDRLRTADEIAPATHSRVGDELVRHGDAGSESAALCGALSFTGGEGPHQVAHGGQRQGALDRSTGGQPGTTRPRRRSEEHTSELPSLMRISYAVFCLKKKTYSHKTEKQIYLNTRTQAPKR